MTAWPFGDLKTFGYRCILADPPWNFANWSAKGEKKNPNQHYPCMSIADIKALPVGHLAHPDGAALVMWTTSPMLEEAFAVLKAWGATYKSMGCWGKRSSTGRSWAFGPGYVLRSCAEPWLVATWGKVTILNHSQRNFIEAPVREHSRKPDEMRQICEALWPGPRCELFGRQSVPGWDVWGNQATKFDERMPA